MKPIGLLSCLRPPSHAAGAAAPVPTLASCHDNPARYAKDLERHFGGDMAKLCAHVAQQSSKQQTAVIDSSEALRDFLGIRNPAGLRKKFLSVASSPRIPDADAPAALAMAALGSGKDTRELRALARLDEVLKKNPPGFHASHDYQQQVETALGSLLQGFDKLSTQAAQQKAVEIIEKHFPQLDARARQDIASCARTIMAQPGVSDDLKNRLQKLIETGGSTGFSTMLLGSRHHALNRIVSSSSGELTPALLNAELGHAVRSGNVARMRELLKQGADPERVKPGNAGIPEQAGELLQAACKINRLLPRGTPAGKSDFDKALRDYDLPRARQLLDRAMAKTARGANPISANIAYIHHIDTYVAVSAHAVWHE